MEPRIQYAKSKDGVSIAFSTLGEGGMPFVQMPFPFSHLQLTWEQPEVRSWLERCSSMPRNRNRREDTSCNLIDSLPVAVV